MTDDGVLVLPGHDDLLLGFAAGGAPVFEDADAGPDARLAGARPLRPHLRRASASCRAGYESRGLLVCLDGNSHKIRWEYRAAGAVESTPVIGDDDVIYFGDNAGEIHAVDFLGNALWTARSALRSAVPGTILAPGRVAFGLDDETLVVLRCSSGGLAAGGWPKLGLHAGADRREIGCSRANCRGLSPSEIRFLTRIITAMIIMMGRNSCLSIG